MNITSLFCRCRGGEVATDHYLKGECTRPPAPLPWLLGTLAVLEEDTEHCDNKITATRLAVCPRKTAIEDNLPLYNLNLMRYNSKMWGVAMHLLMEKYAPKGFVAEKELHGTLFKGTDVEIEIAGRADVIRPDVVLLEDYKATSETNQRSLTENPKAKPEWSIQFSVYKLLDEQSEQPLGIERAGVWNGSIVSKRSKADPWVEIPVRFMTEQEILEAMPFDGNLTVHEHLRIRLGFIDRLWEAAGEDGVISDDAKVREAVADLPLTGMDMAPFMCEYCEVSHICMALQGGAEL